MDTSQVYPTEEETREKFIGYFGSGKGVIESRKFHQNELKMQDNFSENHLTDRRLNPTLRMVREWYNQWKSSNPQNDSPGVSAESAPEEAELPELSDMGNSVVLRRIENAVMRRISEIFESPGDLLNRLIIMARVEDTSTRRKVKFNVSKKRKHPNLTPKFRNNRVGKK